MIEIANEKQCVGCGICQYICPVRCIQMKENKEGFVYPRIDKQKCIQCGKCEQLCQINNKERDKEEWKEKYYWAYHKNETVRKRSSSGGIFFALAEKILEEGGCVCAASFDSSFNVKHEIVYNLLDVYRCQGSKYAQSNIVDVLDEIKDNLKKDRKLLFVGTPCEVQGVKNVIPTVLHKNLYCVDFLCHGVSNNFLLDKYLAELQEKYNSKISSISFRDKKKGWKNYSLSVKFRNGKHYIKDLHTDYYLRAFVNGINLRKSCYECMYGENNNTSDITIGDFWRHKIYTKKKDDNRGISIVQTRTRKGEYLLSGISDVYIQDIYSLDIAKEFFREKRVCSPKREKFFKEIEKYSYKKVVNKILPVHYWEWSLIEIKNYIYNILVRKKYEK